MKYSLFIEAYLWLACWSGLVEAQCRQAVIVRASAPQAPVAYGI